MDGARVNFLKKIFALLVGGVLLSAAALVILAAFDSSVNLDFLAPKLEAMASRSIGRPVTITGSVRLKPSLHPSLEIQHIRIANPARWGSGDFLRVRQALVQVRLLSFIHGRIRFERILLQNATLALSVRPDGRVNWCFDLPPSQGPSTSAPRQFPDLERIALSDIHVRYQDHRRGRDYEFQVDELSGRADRLAKLHLSAKGIFQKHPYELEASGGTLPGLLDLKKTWPLCVSIETAAARLRLSGEVHRKEGLQALLTVRLSGSRTQNLAALLGVGLAPPGPFDLAGRLTLSPGRIELSGLAGTVGKTTFGGRLRLDLAAERPMLNGGLSLAALDLGPVVTAAGPGDGAAAGKTATPAGGNARLPLDFLSLLDARLALTIRKITGIPGRLRDVDLRLHLADGHLKVPVKLRLAGSPISGRLTAAAEQGQAILGLKLHAGKTDVKQMFSALAGAGRGIAGTLGAVTLTATTRGATFRSLLDGLDVRLKAAPSRVKIGAGRAPATIALQRLSLTRAAGRPVDIRAAGTASGEAFSLHLTAADPVQYLDQRPLRLAMRFNGGGARVHLQGFLDPRPTKDRLRLKVSLDGKRVGDLAAWTGWSRDDAMAYHADGFFRYDGDRLRLDLGTIRVGRVEAAGRLDYGALRSAHRVFDIRLSAETLNFEDLRELPAIFAKTPPKARAKTPKPKKFSLENDILPGNFKFKNGKIHITVKAIRLSSSRITDVAFDALFRNGKMAASPFRATLGDETFRGQVALDFNSQIPSIRFSLNAEHVDIAKLLREFQMTAPFHVTAAHFGVDFALKGRHAIDIMRLSALTIRIKDGTWKVSHLGGLGESVIRISDALYTTAPGKTALLNAEGHMGAFPVSIRMREDGLFTHNLTKPFSLSLTARVAATVLKIKARLTAQKIIQSDFSLRFSVSGDRMDSLNTLLGLNLPPIGPYGISGDYHSTPNTANLNNVRVHVGKSRLKGEIRLKSKKTKGGRVIWPVCVDSKFTANSIQLNDFKLPGWSLLQDSAPPRGARPENTRTGATSGAGTPEKKGNTKAGTPVTTLKSLLSPEIVEKIDGRLSVEVKEVKSGSDKLGSGSLAVRLKGGRFTVAPLHINIPGGSLGITAAVKISPEDTAAQIGMKIEHLDYGVLARRIDPRSDMKGWLYLDVQLKSHAENPADLIKYASGHFDFGIVPQKLKAGVFDLWAANLVTAVLPVLAHKEKSEVNCLAAQFDMQNGVMKPRVILVDTTKVRVRGRGEINFRTRKIHLRLIPHPKKPQFFNLATPLEINGTFANFHVGAKTGDVLGSAARFLTSAITVPFQWLTYNKLPADGLKACSKAFKRQQPGK